MIFQFPSGIKDCNVKVYGHPSSTVTITSARTGEVTQCVFGENVSEVDIVLKMGEYTFSDGYVSNVKTFNIRGDTSVVVGFYFGSNGTKTLPAGTYTHIRGTVSGGVSQRNSSGLATNQFPACRTNVSASCSGAVSVSLYSGNIVSMPYRGGSAYDVSRSDSDSSNFDKNISTTGGSLTVSYTRSTSQDSGYSNIIVSGWASMSNVYVY